MQGRFESTKNPVGFFSRKGAIVNSRSSVIENTFMMGVVAGHTRAVGLNGRLFLFFIYASLMRGVGIRALTFELLKDLTRVLLRGLRSVRIGDGSLFQRAGSGFERPQDGENIES